MIQIFVRFHHFREGQKTIAVDTCADETILDLKNKIYVKTGIPVAFQSLIYSGKCLANKMDVASYKITKESNLFLNLRFNNWKCHVCKERNELRRRSRFGGGSCLFGEALRS